MVRELGEGEQQSGIGTGLCQRSSWAQSEGETENCPMGLERALHCERDQHLLTEGAAGKGTCWEGKGKLYVTNFKKSWLMTPEEEEQGIR